MDLWTSAMADGPHASEIVRLEVDGCRIEIATDQSTLRDRLARYFREWVVTPELHPHIRIVAIECPTPDLEVAWGIPEPSLGSRPAPTEYVDLPDGRLVLNRRAGLVFALGAGMHLVMGRCRRHTDELVGFVNDRYLQWRLSQRFLPMRAAAVGRGGRYVALCGAHGAGRSTTAVRLLTEGFDFLAHEQVLLRPAEYGVEILGMPRHPRVNPGTILSLPALEDLIGPTDQIRLRALPQAELAALEHEYDVFVDEVAGADRFTTRGYLSAVVVFNWDAREGEPAAHEVDLSIRPDLLPLLMTTPDLCEEPDRPEDIDLSRGKYLDVLSRRPVVEITGRRDFDAAARLARDVLDRHAP